MNNKILPSCAASALILMISVCANAEEKHDHHGYVYEPVVHEGRTYYCPCNLGSVGRYVTQEFIRQEEIQDMLKKKGKNPNAARRSFLASPSVNAAAESGRVFYVLDEVLMRTTDKAEFENFLKKYVSRKFLCNEVLGADFATPTEGDLKIVTTLDGETAIISRNENTNYMGIKIGSTTFKFVQVPIRVTGYRYRQGKWTSIGSIKVLSEQTIKDDPRKIYKNAMNDAINYYTSPNDMVTKALFEFSSGE